MASKRFSCLEKLPGILPIFRRCFMRYEDPVMRILHHQHPMVRPQRVVAIHMTLSRRSDGTSWPQHLLWGWSMRANVSNPALEPDSAPHREGAGQPDHAVAPRLGCRDPLDGRCEGYPLLLVIAIGTLR